MRPDFVFDCGPARRAKLSDTELLDFLEVITDSDQRVILERQRGGGWELRSTGNRIDGRVSAREAIRAHANLRNYRPRASEPKGILRRLARFVGAA